MNGRGAFSDLFNGVIDTLRKEDKKHCKEDKKHCKEKVVKLLEAELAFAELDHRLNDYKCIFKLTEKVKSLEL